MTKQYEDFEDLLADLEQKRVTIEQERDQINSYKEEIRELKQRLESKQEKLDLSRDKILREANEQARNILQEAKDYADTTIRNFQKYGKAAGVSAKDMEKERGKLREKMSTVDKKLSAKNAAPKKSHKQLTAKDLHIGDSIKVLSLNLKGTVSTLPAAANAQTNLYDVSVSLPSGTKPPIGAFATVTFYTDRRASTISVPTESILTGNNNEQYVFTVNADGTAATRVTVTTGLVTKDSTEIVSGLKAGDRVVTKGQSYLSDGAAVHVVTSDAADGGEG